MRNWLLPSFLLASLSAVGQSHSGRGVGWPVLRLSCCWGIKRHYSRCGLEASQEKWGQQLRERATTRQLTRLCHHYSPVVRVYAFEALRERPDADLWPIVRRHLTDNQLVGTYLGCTQTPRRVSDMFIGAAYDTVEGGARPLSLAQRRQLDSLLVFYPRVRGYMRAVRLAELPPLPGWHARLRELAARATDGDGVLPALASYHDPADVPVLLRALQQPYNGDAVQATEEFPAEALYPALARKFARRLAAADPALCQAMSQYPRPATVQLFRQAFQDEDWKQHGYRIDLAVALRRHPHPLYAELLASLPLSKADEAQVAERLKSLETQP